MLTIELTGLVVSEPENGVGCRFRYAGEQAKVIYEDKGSVRVRFDDEQLAYLPKGSFKIVTEFADEAEKTYCIV